MDSEKDGIASHMLLLTLVAHAMDKSRLRHVLRETIGEEEDFEDEGFEEPPQMARLTYRRSTDLTAGGQGYVAKAIRVRKKHRSDPSRLR